MPANGEYSPQMAVRERERRGRGVRILGYKSGGVGYAWGGRCGRGVRRGGGAAGAAEETRREELKLLDGRDFDE